MINSKLNYHSARSDKARISAWFSKGKIVAITSLSFLLLATSIVLICLNIPLGWAFLGLSFVPAMIIEWYNGELKELPISKKPKNIDDVLSVDVLGYLNQKPSVKEILQIISRTNDGYFFAVRFGLSPSFLMDLIEENSDPTAVFGRALQIYAQSRSDNLSAGILLVAIIDSSDSCKRMLNHLQLDMEDLINGIDWRNYTESVYKNYKKQKKTGGVARDWAFGYTPTLNRFATNISQRYSGRNTLPFLKLEKTDQIIDQIFDIFNKKGRQNVALVGSNGSGKTEMVHRFAAMLMDASNRSARDLAFHQVFLLDAGSLIAAAPDRGGLENLIPRILYEAYKARNIIICLDNAELFFQDGVGSVDISNVLMPFLGGDKVRIILTIDEQNMLKISAKNPELANTLNKIMIQPLSKNETMMVLEDSTLTMEYKYDVIYMYQALREAYDLGSRYIYDLAMPAKAIKIMESAAQYSENKIVSVNSVKQAVEKTLNVKVGKTSDSSEKDKLLNLEDLIHERMINQTRAVSVVSDALRRARAGVSSQNRPIGTFLFLGPTGVGKTELAKSLAAIYFDGEDKIIRVDMNEYSSSGDTARMIVDGADNFNSLTARIMKQPFSVVLLDEIEKAHPNVMATLLQMLDEGIMRDSKNREISFRDAIIIATSNAGANEIRELIDRGYEIDKIEDQIVDGLIKSRQFSPEFINRFDEVVIFKPLGKEELLKVADLMIAGVNKTLESQKISVVVDDEAKKYLVEAGYDPRLGARPMRRVVQKAVENSVAKMVLAGEAEPGSKIEITLDHIKKIV